MIVKRDYESRIDLIGLVKKVIFTDFFKGLRITLGYNVSKSITIRYPDTEKWIPYKRYRGLHALYRNSEGKELCVACELCVKSCPTNCITVVPMEDDTGRGIADRVAKIWRINLVRCMYCGYCEDACPTRAVRLTREYETATSNFAATVRNREELLVPPATPETFEGGVIVRARFERTADGIKVLGDYSNGRKRSL